jgi:hypothetical protein
VKGRLGAALFWAAAGCWAGTAYVNSSAVLFIPALGCAVTATALDLLADRKRSTPDDH